MAELNKIPTEQELRLLIGEEKLSSWNNICAEIDSLYDMERQWNDGGKKWTYEYKYRRGGKTLCALYAKPGSVGFMLIFGKEERDKVDAVRGVLASETLEIFDSATIYHDGKWVMFDETLPVGDMKTLLEIKRKPNKKQNKTVFECDRSPFRGWIRSRLFAVSRVGERIENDSGTPSQREGFRNR